MTLPSSGPLSLNDIQTEFGGTNPIGMNEYYAGGGLVPAGTSGTYGAVPSSGTISIQNFYGTSNFVPIYIEEVFQTWLYTGNNSTNTITNGINLSANGGLVWMKGRGAFAENHNFVDTARGVTKSVSSNNSDAELTNAGAFSSFNTTGFTLGPVNAIEVNSNGRPYVSWTFRKQPKFFDIVTYTGDGTAGRAISHNLGSVPGCVIVKRTDSSANWVVWHRSLSNPSKFLILDSTAAEGTDVNGPWGPFSSGYTTNASAFTSTVFRVANDIRSNASGATYVAYIFAHDAGGFGLTGTDNVISCGSFVDSTTVNLGYEPQWVLYKRASGGASNWFLVDNMRGFTTTVANDLQANTSNAEGTTTGVTITSTGFVTSVATGTWIYIAIRRGPMKTPTTGTSVFTPVATRTATGATVPPLSFTANFPVDLSILGWKDGGISSYQQAQDRLRGEVYLATSLTAAETSSSWKFDSNAGIYIASVPSSTSQCAWLFRRAPGFFDVVCYAGTGANRTVNHNLGVVPELMIVKGRTGGATEWTVYNQTIGNTEGLRLNSDIPASGRPTAWNNTSPTASVFTLGTSSDVNNSSLVYVAYLFASCPGVSKVGTYTGTGALQTINCGFTGGARFVLIKRTDSTGDWFTYDSARGITSGNDPYLLMNSTAAEVTGTNYVDTTSVGFQVTAAAPAGLNANGGTYIFLAIA